MHDNLVADLLPTLVGRGAPTFNVFDVMRHGTHEKQISNVFAWLLDREGSHGLGDRFQQVFVRAVNRSRAGARAVTMGRYSARQEVNTAEIGQPMDIADLVVEDDDTVLVIENYRTSDGHGHNYQGYLEFGRRAGKYSVVVMLCGSVDRTLLADGWEHAALVSYPDVISALVADIERDRDYRARHPDQITFLRHLQARVSKEPSMNDDDMLRFVNAMCTSGAAHHYRTQNVEVARVNFADTLRQNALEQFVESRTWLQQVKGAAKSYSSRILLPQLAERLGDEPPTKASAGYAGIFQWTINFQAPQAANAGESLQLKFGPSAWFANEEDEHWKQTVVRPDYTHLFITRVATKEIRQSAVTLSEILAGLPNTDYRLRDEILSLLD